MGRRQTDKWVRLALIAEALRRHGRGKASRLILVKSQIHRFLAELLSAIGEEKASDLGEDLWRKLLWSAPETWKRTYNEAVRSENRYLPDDPVPKSVIRALRRRYDIDLRQLADALREMPVRARGGGDRVSERLDAARVALHEVEGKLWRQLLAQARWRSPLLVMDEAHHLKNPGTLLARQLQSPDSERDLRTGDAALANAFDRMLFLTATPFQLGHQELVSVLTRFGDVRWDERELGDREIFLQRLRTLADRLNDSQRTAIALQRCWSRLRVDDCNDDVDVWWTRLRRANRESVNSHQRAVLDAFEAAKRCRNEAQEALRPWLLRHDKGMYWRTTRIARRERLEGAAIAGPKSSAGLAIPPEQLLPFFLAARSAVDPGKDLLGEALSSSYEAFRDTRRHRKAAKDEQEVEEEEAVDLPQARWYLGEFDEALVRCSGSSHPKVFATVRRVVDLWESGEKVLVFAFYQHTCRALRVHISREVELRLMSGAQGRLRSAGRQAGRKEVERLLGRIQSRYFDDSDSPGRRALDAALSAIVVSRARLLDAAGVAEDQRRTITDVMRRFLRVTTTLVRCFPLEDVDSLKPDRAVARTLEQPDASGVSWRQKFEGFVEFLVKQCSTEERRLYLDAAEHLQTGGIRVEHEEEEGEFSEGRTGTVTLANVQVAIGTTRRHTRARLMRAFNTPFFPDILVCSQVMGEGVDLQRFCRHVIHHDLAWNPSTIEQRTGRIDRLGCKAEGKHPIVVYLPFLAGTSDERQFRVMSEREQWFRVVMGQDDVGRLITADSSSAVPLPAAVAEELRFKLGLE
jgi:hypothetical protein